MIGKTDERSFKISDIIKANKITERIRIIRKEIIKILVKNKLLYNYDKIEVPADFKGFFDSIDYSTLPIDCRVPDYGYRYNKTKYTYINELIDRSSDKIKTIIVADHDQEDLANELHFVLSQKNFHLMKFDYKYKKRNTNYIVKQKNEVLKKIRIGVDDLPHMATGVLIVSPSNKTNQRKVVKALLEGEDINDNIEIVKIEDYIKMMVEKIASKKLANSLTRHDNVEISFLRYVTAFKMKMYLDKYCTNFPMLCNPKVFGKIDSRLHKSALIIDKYITTYMDSLYKQNNINFYNSGHTPLLYNIINEIYRVFDQNKIYDMDILKEFTIIRKFSEEFEILRYIREEIFTEELDMVKRYINSVTGGLTPTQHIRIKGKKDESKKQSSGINIAGSSERTIFSKRKNL
jgi:hypothetical protein